MNPMVSGDSNGRRVCTMVGGAFATILLHALLVLPLFLDLSLPVRRTPNQTGAGASAYVSEYDTTTVESTAGAVYAYRVTDSRGLVLSNSFPTQGAPGTETSHGPNPGVIYGPNLYVLSNACYGPLCRPSGYINRFTIDEAGDLTPAGAIFLGIGGPGIAYSDMVLVPAD